MRNPAERIRDMLDAISCVLGRVPPDRQTFQNDELLQTYFVHYLQILGEAAYKLPQDFRTAYPDIPWSDIIGMRHVLVHDYFRIDLDIVWGVVEKQLPELRGKLEALLTQLDEGA